MLFRSVTICSTSGLLAGEFCPASDLHTGVYIIGGSPDTEDGAYLLSDDLTSSTCNVHTAAPVVEAPSDLLTEEGGTDAPTKEDIEGDGTNSDKNKTDNTGNNTGNGSNSTGEDNGVTGEIVYTP